jgi:hypothetical protein
MTKKAKAVETTMEEFLETYSGAPYDREEVARGAARTAGPLGRVAQAWLDADKAFSAALKAAGYEEG